MLSHILSNVFVKFNHFFFVTPSDEQIIDIENYKDAEIFVIEHIDRLIALTPLEPLLFK